MADVRSLLRNERGTRRINHPYATYGTSGKLLCTICNLPIKTESLWSNHLRHPDHVGRVEKLRSASQAQTSKKRKADDDEDEEDEGRKRTKGVESDDEEVLSATTVQHGLQPDHKPVVADKPDADAEAGPLTDVKITTGENVARLDEEDDEEWLDLQRAIKAADAVPASAIGVATISAPAMSAEEVAAQAREEQSVQRGKRDVEREAEVEDAARALEDEFQEMEELEARVRKLREKREALRGATVNGNVATTTSPASGTVNKASQLNGDGVPLQFVDEDDDDDDFDEWNFGGT